MVWYASYDLRSGNRAHPILAALEPIWGLLSEQPLGLQSSIFTNLSSKLAHLVSQDPRLYWVKCSARNVTAFIILDTVIACFNYLAITRASDTLCHLQYNLLAGLFALKQISSPKWPITYSKNATHSHSCCKTTTNATSITDIQSASTRLHACMWRPLASVITTLYYVAIIFHHWVWYPVLSLCM